MSQVLGWIDVSKYNIVNPVRDECTIFPYIFSRFSLSYVEQHELDKACPKCGKRQTICLGTYVSSDIFHNVFACLNCLIAWDVGNRTGRHEPWCVDRAESLVRALYDPDFDPNSLRDGEMVVCQACGGYSDYLGSETCPQCGREGSLVRADLDEMETNDAYAEFFRETRDLGEAGA